MFLYHAIFIQTELAHPIQLLVQRFYGNVILSGCALVSFGEYPLFLANEDPPPDLASRKRRDRWHYYHFHALSCELIAP